MTPLAIGWVVSATICLSLALLQALTWIQRRSENSYLNFSITAFAAAGVAMAELKMGLASSVDDFVLGFKLANYSLAVLFIALVWFIVAYAESQQRALAWFASAAWFLGAIINAIRPTGLALAEVTSLTTGTTPWGESFTIAVARTDATKLLADLGTLAVLLLAVQSCVISWRQGQTRRAVLLGSIALFMGVALAHTTLVDLGILASPYLISYSFVAIVVVTSYELASRVASAATLSQRVRDDERRWRALLDGVELLVARIRSGGLIEYVNPHFCRVSGFSEGELLGRHIQALIPDLDRNQALRELDEAFRGDIEPSYETSLMTRDQELRTVIWRNVLFRGSEYGESEILAVGVDVTERREAEGDRDQALEEIKALKAQLEEENFYLKAQIELDSEFTEIVGESQTLKYVLFRIEQVAPTDTTVLIQGETGVGKELTARAIHERSKRAEKAFVRLNCAALPPNLVESELFGHVAGAFTDAKGQRVGRFELGDGGTFFLDEVSELPLELQPKLLRVLQDGEFEPVGSSETRHSDVRLIAATNRDLEQEIAVGRFREDLFYRLHVYPITVPPLRDRDGDLPLLIEYLLPQICARVGRTIHEVPSSVMRSLQTYSWPGNVRQLQNVLEESVVISDDGILRLPPHFGASDAPEAGTQELDSLADVEREHILRVLEFTDGQIAGKGGAAQILEIHPNTLRSRMKKLGLSANRPTSTSD
jgi:PAS domain S-box-containing protein